MLGPYAQAVFRSDEAISNLFLSRTVDEHCAVEASPTHILGPLTVNAGGDPLLVLYFYSSEMHRLEMIRISY